jgi:hypothetical protein
MGIGVVTAHAVQNRQAKKDPAKSRVNNRD